MSDIDGASRGSPGHRGFHVALRVLIIATAGLLFVGSSASLSALLRNFGVEIIAAKWLIVSTLLFPLCVVAEMIWMRRSSRPHNRRALLIDGILAASWFLIFWIWTLYGLVHHAWL